MANTHHRIDRVYYYEVEIQEPRACRTFQPKRYRISFRAAFTKQSYESINEVQSNLYDWPKEINHERPNRVNETRGGGLSRLYNSAKSAGKNCPKRLPDKYHLSGFIELSVFDFYYLSNGFCELLQQISEIIDCKRQAVFECNFRLPSQYCLCSRNIG